MAPIFLDGPPLGHTGGFGEPTCHTCHFDGDVNEPSGMLHLAGLPERYAPGERYEVRLVLSRPGLRWAGFQASIRDATTGTNAGILHADTPDLKVQSSDSGVAYVMHTRAGATPSIQDTARWRFTWTAPDTAVNSVAIHVAGNAADGDESPFGDAIYTWSLTLRPVVP
jgi:hypothetical protein